MRKGTIFDIKRYAIHDGPGIRTTVFFKGCNLLCPWCHNPEGIDKEQEIMYDPQKCAEDCLDCVSACPQKAITKTGKQVSIDRSRCDLCGDCEEACAYEAVKIIGREVAVQEVLDEIQKDRIFYEESGGGVTLSGGEPLAQPEFLMCLLDELEKKDIHTVLDTSGNVPFNLLDKVSEKVNLFLYDLKVMDEERHRRFTGESNILILENLKRLTGKDKKIIIRIPVLAGVNDDQENVRKTAEFLRRCGSIRKINLLPYHRGGEEKYKRLERRKTFPKFHSPSQSKIQAMQEMFSAYGLTTKIGG